MLEAGNCINRSVIHGSFVIHNVSRDAVGLSGFKVHAVKRSGPAVPSVDNVQGSAVDSQRIRNEVAVSDGVVEVCAPT